MQDQTAQVSPVEKLRSAISLAETMPPSKIRKNLIGLVNLAPEIEDVLMEKIDLPLQIENADPDHPFLKTQFNRDGDSYRSCFDNKYYPPVEGYTPTGELRTLQELGNVLFSEYTKLYYGNGGISSLYVSEGADNNNFSIGFYAKKDCTQANQFGFIGSWDSFNVADIKIVGDEATISLNTTVMIEMNIQSEKNGAVDLTGFLKKSKAQKRKIGKEKIEQVLVAFGEMVQDLQTIMRSHLQAIYIGKTREAVFSTRFENTVQFQNHRRSLAKGLRQIHLHNS